MLGWTRFDLQLWRLCVDVFTIYTGLKKILDKIVNPYIRMCCLESIYMPTSYPLLVSLSFLHYKLHYPLLSMGNYEYPLVLILNIYAYKKLGYNHFDFRL